MFLRRISRFTRNDPPTDYKFADQNDPLTVGQNSLRDRRGMYEVGEKNAVPRERKTAFVCGIKMFKSLPSPEDFTTIFIKLVLERKSKTLTEFSYFYTCYSSGTCRATHRYCKNTRINSNNQINGEHFRLIKRRKS